ncbi:hypothetical protein M0811_14246 [Anaeramoeba ignava]|uniref:Uncharacterized protein n=1 Tax=Anaeramoeba ignava TaxID=1746090 RepID=A0A9Q0LV01_ANAIG|nr:hypothetical protein M0811_13695 [Anaeramoeba ignava]KAJ5079103.1 hypothetical protein M0811_14609 [Anaeramoeba ignava]KAJ5079106.1 hypothetical protein M0811_14612 [Anaeramoeba ignava]KAJ5079516.1 hypothetical protein M0811_14472 [Anaeramoeba ignava]KAJ5079517.1 hypothetical protein M0811_14473 [Anaeramoeba ignava]
MFIFGNVLSFEISHPPKEKAGVNILTRSSTEPPRRSVAERPKAGALGEVKLKDIGAFTRKTTKYAI